MPGKWALQTILALAIAAPLYAQKLEGSWRTPGGSIVDVQRGPDASLIGVLSKLAPQAADRYDLGSTVARGFRVEGHGSVAAELLIPPTRPELRGKCDPHWAKAVVRELDAPRRLHIRFASGQYVAEADPLGNLMSCKWEDTGVSEEVEWLAADAPARDAARVVLATGRRTLKWRDTLRTAIAAYLASSNATPPIDFSFQLSSPGADDEVFAVTSAHKIATLRVAYSDKDSAYVLSSNEEPLALLEPGRYTLRARAALSDGVVESDTVNLVLHPPTILKVYEPAEDARGTAIEAIHGLSELREKQPFRVAVMAPSLGDQAPEEISIVVKTSRDEYSRELTRAEHGAAGQAAYDMKGNTITTYGGPNVFVWADHLMDKVLYKRDIDTVRVRYADAEVKLPIYVNSFVADAARLLEMLKDYKAMYDVTLSHVLLSAPVRSEFQAKSNMLDRAIALHDRGRDVPAMIRITTSRAYLGLIQSPLSALGPARTRYLGPDVLKERMAGQQVPVGNDAEEREIKAAIRQADVMAMNAVVGVFADIGQMPIQFVENIPAMLASPVYSGYTLLSGRQIDGQWASGQQKFFAGVEVGLTFVGLSAGALKHLRPKLYDRAAEFLRPTRPTPIVVDNYLKAAYRAELAERIVQRQGSIARFRATIGRAESELADLRTKRAPIESRIQDLNTQLAAFPEQSPAAGRIEANRKKIADIENNARERRGHLPPSERLTPSERARINTAMERMNVERALMERQMDELRESIAKAEGRRDGVAAAEAAARQRMAEKGRQIANAEADIAKWRAAPDRVMALPGMRKKRARRLKDQGNRGEALAFEAVSRDGYIRHLERNGPLPNAMANWKEVADVVDGFGKKLDDLSAGLGIDPAELQRLVRGGDATDLARLGEARDLIQDWRRRGVPYTPSGSIGPDGLYWNPKTNNFRVVEVKTGSSALGATQLTDAGIERWIRIMRDPSNKLYRPGAAEALNVALRSGTLERVVIRVDSRVTEIIGTELVDGAGRKIPVK